MFRRTSAKQLQFAFALLAGGFQVSRSIVKLWHHLFALIAGMVTNANLLANSAKRAIVDAVSTA